MSTLPQLVTQTREKLLSLVRELDPDGGVGRGDPRQARPRRRWSSSARPTGARARWSTRCWRRRACPRWTPRWPPRRTWCSGTPSSGRPAPATRASSRRCRSTCAELVNWVSAAHELPAGELPPRYVEVDGPVALLEKLSIVDTPGVGGLDSVHGELAAEAAATATALLFVVDASAPFTRGELNFLRPRRRAGRDRRLRAVQGGPVPRLAAGARGRPGVAGRARAPVRRGHCSTRCRADVRAWPARRPNPDAAAMLRERSGVGGAAGRAAGPGGRPVGDARRGQHAARAVHRARRAERASWRPTSARCRPARRRPSRCGPARRS